MRILLINPPNCGRSIPEERYGIDSLKQIFRGEPLALEVLAGNLTGHEVRILDLKVEPDSLQAELTSFAPDLVGFTAMTCEANTVLRLAREARENCVSKIVVGGVHASNDPEFFNRTEIDFVVVGLGKRALRELVDNLEKSGEVMEIAGVAVTDPSRPLSWRSRDYGHEDLVEEHPPRYDLVESYRSEYTLRTLGLEMGFVASACGCPFNCSFCCIAPITGGRYLTSSAQTVLRDIRCLERTPVIRLVDANTFGDPQHARQLAEAIRDGGIRKHFVADVRSDTVVRYPELLQLWKEIGLRAVIIGLEEVSDAALDGMNKACNAAVNREAIRILRQIGLTIVGDFIISPDYDERRFDTLSAWTEENPVNLPMYTVLTPLPGTALYTEMKNRITNHDLDYYTLTNAVVPTFLEERTFYEKFAALIKTGHDGARL
jgi:radical SAM superfamily enzyme YgiQ (UPF0313 family)